MGWSKTMMEREESYEALDSFDSFHPQQPRRTDQNKFEKGKLRKRLLISKILIIQFKIPATKPSAIDLDAIQKMLKI
jgi:hypothetical protein